MIAINFINTAWNIDVKTTTIANCFRHYKIRSDEGVATEQQVGEDEGIHGLHEVIYGLYYRNTMDVKHLLNYPCENNTVMESPTDEEIIQGVIGTSADDDYDLDDSYSLPNASTKEVFQPIEILNTYLLQQEKYMHM